MSFVRNRLKIYGNVKNIYTFITDNYEKDSHHHIDGGNLSNLILFFGKLFPTPVDIENDKDKVYRYRMNNWGTPFLAKGEQTNTLIVRYKHDYDYTNYELTNDNGLFNGYSLLKLLEYSEMFYGENIHPSENELITEFTTVMSPPNKLVINWINKYQYTNLVFKLDYWDEDDRFVGKIYYDHQSENYVLEHHVKEHNPIDYIYYMLDNDIRTIEMYADDIVDLLLILKPEKTSDVKEIRNMLIDEIDQKNSLKEQAEFIDMMLVYLNNKLKCNS